MLLVKCKFCLFCFYFVLYLLTDLNSTLSTATHVMGVMTMANIVPRTGTKPPYLAFRVNVLTHAPPRLRAITANNLEDDLKLNGLTAYGRSLP